MEMNAWRSLNLGRTSGSASSPGSCVIMNSQRSSPLPSFSSVVVHCLPGNGAPNEFQEPCSDTSWRSMWLKVATSSPTSCVGMPMNTTCPPGPARRTARFAVAGCPAASTMRSQGGTSGRGPWLRKVCVAPASRACSSFCSDTSTATTCEAPISRIHWIANSPIGPQPTTPPVCPIANGAFQIACSAIDAGSVIAAARGSIPAGVFRRLPRGTDTYSA